MEATNILIDRLGKHKYRYVRGHFDIDKVPDVSAHKSCYINTFPQSDGSADLQMDSTSGANVIREQFIIYLVDFQKNRNLNQFINDRNSELTEIIINRGADKVVGIAKIEISSVRNGDTDKYLI